MKIYEFYDEDFMEVSDMANKIKEIATYMVKCLDKAEEKEGNSGGEMNFRRRGPRMRGGRSNFIPTPQMRGGQGGFMDVPPHMRGYVVRPEDEDWAYNERYNWMG